MMIQKEGILDTLEISCKIKVVGKRTSAGRMLLP